jgi:cytochrome c553
MREETDLTIRIVRLIAGAIALCWSAVGAQAGDLAAGEARYGETCANCHGKSGRGMASFPSLKGKDADYVADRLTRYRAGEKIGPNALLMIPMASDLTDEQIANLAAFVSTKFK